MNYNRIKEWLAIRGKTAIALANHLNRSRQAVSFWNRNVTQPEIPTLYLIAEFLDVEVADLLTKRSDLKLVKGKNIASKTGVTKAQIKGQKSKKKS